MTAGLGRLPAGLGIYIWTLSANEGTGNLSAKLMFVDANPQTQTLLEGQVAGMGALTQGGDNIGQLGTILTDKPGKQQYASELRGQTVVGASAGDTTPSGAGVIIPFASLTGGWMRQNSGSHVDSSGLSLVSGYRAGQYLYRSQLPGGRSA